MTIYIREPNRGKSSETAILPVLLTLGGSALLLGTALAIFPPDVVIGIVLAPLFLAVAWSFPGLAILFIFAVLYGIVPNTVVPSVSAVGGQFRGEDFFVVALFLVLLMKRIGHPMPSFGGFRPFVAPLLFLFVLTTISFANAMFIQGTGLKPIFQETRYFFYWLMAPMVVIAIDTRPKLSRFVVGIMIVALLVALGAIILQTTGVLLVNPGQHITTLSTLDQKMGGIVRNKASGSEFVVFALFLISARYLLKLNGLAMGMLLSGVLAFEILSTFTRSLWGASILGMVLMGWWLGPRYLLKVAVAGTALAVASIALVSVLKPELLGAVVARASSVGTEVQRGSSLEYRRIEARNVVNQLSAHPFGIGLGARVHNKFNHIMDDNLMKYVHNGYLYLTVKLGILAIIFPIWLAWVFYRQSRAVLASRPASSDRALVVSLMATLVMLYVFAMTEPEWMNHEAIALIATLIGLLAAVTNISRRDKLEQAESAESYAPPVPKFRQEPRLGPRLTPANL